MLRILGEDKQPISAMPGPFLHDPATNITATNFHHSNGYHFLAYPFRQPGSRPGRGHAAAPKRERVFGSVLVTGAVVVGTITGARSFIFG